MENFSKRTRTKFRKTDYKSKNELFPLNEKGFILLNNLISLFVILMLLTAIGSIIVWSIQRNKEIRADIELQRELAYVIERITEDANLADYVKLDTNIAGNGIFIRYQTKPNTLKNISYTKRDAPTPGLSRIIVNDETAPMTGNSMLGEVHITNFKVQKISNHLFSVELEGISQITQHTYKIKTVIYTQGEVI